MLHKKLDGKEAAAAITAQAAAIISKSEVPPHLVVVTVGEDAASKVYVRNKKKKIEEVGGVFNNIRLPESATTADVVAIVQEECKKPKTGVIVQLPLPPHINKEAVLAAIDPQRDVDGFCCGSRFKPCTPEGIMWLLEYYNIEVSGKDVVIFGRSDIVGKPLAKLMLDANATVTLVHSHTSPESRIAHLTAADIVVLAVGNPNCLSAAEQEMLKDKVVIDVGINRDCQRQSRICGDVPEEVKAANASAYTPVPGGVGPMTVAVLVMHVAEL